jgi:hypothetical protein
MCLKRQPVAIARDILMDFDTKHHPVKRAVCGWREGDLLDDCSQPRLPFRDSADRIVI